MKHRSRNHCYRKHPGLEPRSDFTRFHDRKVTQNFQTHTSNYPLLTLRVLLFTFNSKKLCSVINNSYLCSVATEGAQVFSEFFIDISTMIDKALVSQIAEKALEDSDLFLVDVTVSKDNRIVVEVDSPGYMDVEQCVALSHKIEAELDRDAEDFELEVGSAGLTSPFKVKAQFDKNVGNEVEVLTRDGRKFSGTLVETTDEGFTVEVPRKVKKEGAKRPVIEMQPEKLSYGDAKSVKYVINFK